MIPTTFLTGPARTTARALCVLAAATLLTACQTESPSASAAAPEATNLTTPAAAQPTEPMRALKFREIQKLFSGKSFAAINEPLNGVRSHDAWIGAMTYLRDDTNRAYRHYPNWSSKNLAYSALGPIYKGKQQKPVTIDGKVYANNDTFCITDELSRNSRACDMVFVQNGRYYLNGKRNAEITITDGYDAMMGPLVSRAVKDDNNKLLWALAGDFSRLEPDLVAKFRKADNNIFIKNARAEQKRREEIQAENARIRAAQAAKRKKDAAAAEARRQAKCKAATGKACAPSTSSGGLVGALVGGLVAVVDGPSDSAPRSSSTYRVKYKYTLQCRERVLFDVDSFKKGPSFECTGEVYKCEAQFEQQLASRFGSKDKACAASYGSSYTAEGINRTDAY